MIRRIKKQIKTFVNNGTKLVYSIDFLEVLIPIQQKN